MRTSPLKHYRQEASLSQNELAFQLNLTSQTIQKTEHCLYPSPSPSLVRWMASHSFKTEQHILSEYHLWQTDKRSEFILPDSPHSFSGSVEAFKFRQLVSSSLMDFCKKFCLHPSQWARLEKKGGSKSFCEAAFLESGCRAIWLNLK